MELAAFWNCLGLRLAYTWGMSEMNRIRYTQEAVFGATPESPMGGIKPMHIPAPSYGGRATFSGIATGSPKGVAQFLRELADHTETLETPEITIEVKGPLELMPKVKA